MHSDLTTWLVFTSEVNKSVQIATCDMYGNLTFIGPPLRTLLEVDELVERLTDAKQKVWHE